MKLSRIVGENIRVFRHNEGWSQEKLAVRANLHYNYISMLERGRQGISVDTLHAIAKALDVPMDCFWLRVGIGNLSKNRLKESYFIP